MLLAKKMEFVEKPYNIAYFVNLVSIRFVKLFLTLGVLHSSSDTVYPFSWNSDAIWITEFSISQWYISYLAVFHKKMRIKKCFSTGFPD